MTENPCPSTSPFRWRASVAGYWHQSRRPLASLVFVSPLLVLYEGGLIWLGPSAMRNGADMWLRQILDAVGLTGYFLLPVLTVGLLMAWHHTTRLRWRVRPAVLSFMLVESAVLGCALAVVAHLQVTLLVRIAPHCVNAATAPIHFDDMTVFGRLVSFFGAGIYEEVLFRLLLLPLAACLIGVLGSSMSLRRWGAIGLSSLLFAVAHYVGPHGESFVWFTFLFRFLAGTIFGLLFVFRGFGIAAGSHTLYDVLVGV